MNKIFTFLVTTLLAVAFSLQSHAQSFWEITDEPVTTIEPGTNYMLRSPWEEELRLLCGNTIVNNTTEGTVYNFEEVGKTSDNLQLYRLRQVSTGKYLEDPDLSNGVVTMTPSADRAFVFTALLGDSVNSADDLDGDGVEEALTEDWHNANPRTRFDPMNKNIANAFVLCNKKLESQLQVFCVWPGLSCFWKPQYTNTRVWHVYKTKKTNAFNDLNLYLSTVFPDGIEGLFSAGTRPGDVPENFIKEFTDAYNAAVELGNGVNNQEPSVYEAAKERLIIAYKACQDNMCSVTPGYYIIANNPDAGRPEYAKTDNACMTEIGKSMHWAGFTKPEVMTIDDAAFIWQITKAENGGWYLRNYGTNHYAGGMKENYHPIPMVEQPTQIYDIALRKGGYFSFDQRGQHELYPALHADKNPDRKVVIWESTSNASWWKLIPVDESELKPIEDQLEQGRLNSAARQLISEAKLTYAKGCNYTSSATPDSLYQTDNMGLVTSADKYFSYTPEPTEGKLENNGLLDNDQTTIFHSCWSTTDYKGMAHNICADLTNKYDAIAIKYSRRNASENGVPTLVHVYASNDTTGGNWTDEGFMNLTYKYPSNDTYTDGKISNFTGIASIGLSKPYRFVRFDVEKTKNNASANSGVYFNLSELRVYEATFDKNTSLIEAVPKDVLDEFNTAFNKAQEEIANGNISKETYNALEAAYKKLVDNFPDPDIVLNLLKEVEAQANNAVEGTELGYFETGAIQALKDVINAVRGDIKDVMSTQEISDAKAKLDEALKAFTKKLIVPDDNQFFYIKCATESTVKGSAANNYLFAENNDEGIVRYAITDKWSEYPNFIWKSIKNDDGTYSFMNIATGTYIGNPNKNNQFVKMTYEKDSVTLRSAKIAGVFNFVCADNVFYNAQPGTNNLVTWNSANGADNSAFIFEPWSKRLNAWDGETVRIDLDNQNARIASYPFDLIGYTYNATLYKVLGLKNYSLKLKAYTDDEIIPAGTPFIIIPNEESEEGGKVTHVGACLPETKSEESTFTYSFEPKEQNGMIATIQSKDSIAGGGILFENKVVLASNTDVCRANSGYFFKTPSPTEEEGTFSLAYSEDVANGIGNLIVVSKENAAVYSISGVKIRNNANLKNLPKGVYIVGDKKVLVK